MDDSKVCTPLLAESDAQKNTSNSSYKGSVTDADKVIITNTDSIKVEGVKRDEDLLKGLLADDYCHVCEAVLLFESQRLSHYEGKKHAQRVRVYLQAKRAERTKQEDAAAQVTVHVKRTMTTDKDHFCELCSMMFSSPVVATSHYEGKVHARNIRKQDRRSETSPAEDTVSRSAQEGSAELPDPPVSTSSPNTEVDTKDPNKYCSLCAVSFNNPHTALQHYNGRKHQRNLSRQELLKGVEDHIKQAGLVCQICSVQLNSVEMYKAHMQGNKHLSRQKKVVDLCNTQQVYETFADELSDYIQIQKARGINPKPPALPSKDTQQEEEKEKSVGEDVDSRADNVEVTNSVPNVSRKYNSPHLSLTGCHSPAERSPPPHLDRSGSFYSLDYSSGPPLPFMRRKHRKPSSSSASSSSSYSSGASDSEDTKYRDRKRRERTKRPRCEESEKVKGRKWFGREKQRDSEERGRKTRKNHSRQRGQDRKCQVEDAEPVPREREMDSLKLDYVTSNHKDTEQEGGEMDESSGHKNRKEKKRARGKVDTRTEEERLWDVSILGF
ncbi:zinc finger matrin-type protein 1 isoform X3 [Takifugu rubripes]|uniref:Lysine-rich coiled-coil protein 1 n=1 Tax=Takifugu rubripes TaxID=31033 RepID=H2UM54_TAKRU|nr:zinc finger matrin-type protein 1-like isoform X3 [Takifugu rubripes]|eukprot:XP_011612494.1 PREDICTED: zinc finger matrin-type protein 1-like isoform X2 [Takifugu rubripes]